VVDFTLGGSLTETEKVRFKILNRLAKYRLKLLPSGCWVKEGTNIRRYTSVRWCEQNFTLHVLSAAIFLNHDLENDKLLVCHKCDIEGCCNPEHLYSGSHQDNSNDMRYRRQNNIVKGTVVNRPESKSPKEFDLEFLS
jgi:hypothetical protein